MCFTGTLCLTCSDMSNKASNTKRQESVLSAQWIASQVAKICGSQSTMTGGSLVNGNDSVFFMKSMKSVPTLLNLLKTSLPDHTHCAFFHLWQLCDQNQENSFSGFEKRFQHPTHSSRHHFLRFQKPAGKDHWLQCAIVSAFCSWAIALFSSCNSLSITQCKIKLANNSSNLLFSLLTKNLKNDKKTANSCWFRRKIDKQHSCSKIL